MEKTHQIFKRLKLTQTASLKCCLAIVKQTRSKNPENQFNIKYIDISEDLETHLKNIIIRKINSSKGYEEYSYDCAEPDEDSVKTIENERTSFQNIFNILCKTNPEKDKIISAKELIEFKPDAYLIILRDDENIKIIGFRTIPANWKVSKRKGIESILFKEHRFEQLEEQDIFSIYKTLDFIYFEDVLFILSKKNFETALKFREGMFAKVKDLSKDVEDLELFSNFNMVLEAAEE